ncbi:MAG: glycosyltransferase family 4 protein [Verrucomicrobia bacterium]|nr:glycosyltransferase family 4 protein [Verrucomicrobiota bacterium]
MNPPASRPRLAVVLSHPTQYYSPWFRWMAARPELALRVFYLWDSGVREQVDPEFGRPVRWDVDLLSGYEHEFVPNLARRPGADHFWGFRNPGLPGRLAAWNPDAVLLFGYAWASHLRALAWCRWRGLPVILRGDSHFLGRNPRALRRLPLRLLVRACTGFAVVGAANRGYYRALGVPAHRLFFAPHAVDHSLFDPDCAATKEEAARLRKQLALSPATRVVLFAGKFTPGKQPAALLEAFLRLEAPDSALVLVGDGGEKEALTTLAARARPGTVHFLPLANQSEMPARYLLADVLALPSRAETWGLVVNEAMHLGRPCLVSDRVGCQQDLVTPGETGWVFRHDDPADLQRQLQQALQVVGDPSQAGALRTRVLARISRYTYAQTTAGLLAALEFALGPRRQ